MKILRHQTYEKILQLVNVQNLHSKDVKWEIEENCSYLKLKITSREKDENDNL